MSEDDDPGNQRRMAPPSSCGSTVSGSIPNAADIEAAISRKDLGISLVKVIRQTPKGNSRRTRARMAKRSYGHRKGSGRRKARPITEPG